MQHLSIFDYIAILVFDYIAVSGSIQGRWIEYVDHLHEMFVYPIDVRGGSYRLPTSPGFSSEMTSDAVRDYEYPHGRVWRERLQAAGSAP